MTNKRILLAEDEPDFRQLVQEMLDAEPDIKVVAETSNGIDALCVTRELKPDLVLMDVRMPHINGIEATRLIKSVMPEIKVIMLTLFDEEEYREAAFASGASAYVLKKAIATELIPSIRRTFQSEGK